MKWEVDMGEVWNCNWKDDYFLGRSVCEDEERDDVGRVDIEEEEALPAMRGAAVVLVALAFAPACLMVGAAGDARRAPDAGEAGLVAEGEGGRARRDVSGTR